MGWGSIARQAAAAEYGRQNWRRFAARRRGAAVLAVLAAAALFGGGWLARHWRPGWGLWAAAAGVVAVVAAWLLLLAVRTRRW